MAPTASLPNIDMSAVQEMDIQQSYWLMFDKMKDDFVHKKDLELILQSALVNGGTQSNSAGPVVVVGATVTATVTDAVARATAKSYIELARTGGVVRRQIISGLEKLT